MYFLGKQTYYTISNWLNILSTSKIIADPPQYSYYQLSRTYFIEGKLDEALEGAQNELKLYPRSTHTYYILGLTYGYMGNTYEAVNSFSKYIEHHPETWAGRNDKAWLQFRVGDIDGALSTIEPIAHNFKSTPWVQNTYCILLINKKRYLEAKDVCENAKKIIDKMEEKDWGHAYPGNDPRIYSRGLQSMRQSIEENLKLMTQNIPQLCIT